MDQNFKSLVTAIAMESAGEYQNVAESANLYAELAQAEDPNAMVRLGVLLEEHPELVREYGTADQWFRKATGYRHPRGYYNLGRHQYDHEIYDAAIENFQAAVSLGDATSFVYLGLCYERGQGVATDTEAAFSCYRSAALLGEFHGVLKLSSLARRHRFTEADLNWVFHCLDCYVHRGEPRAAFETAMLLLDGKSPSDRSTLSVFEYMKIAADGNLDEAQRWVAEAFLCDLWGERNYEQAADYLSRSSDAGNPLAIHRLGTLYMKGDGVPLDLTKSKQLFQQAAEKGNSDSARVLELWDEFAGR